MVHPRTRKQGITLAMWGAKNVGMPLARSTATISANFARAASPHVARASGLALSGYALGTVFGVGLSNHFFGDKGREDAIELYSDPRKFWKEGIVGAPGNIRKIIHHYSS